SILVGTVKGGILIYNNQTSRKFVVPGKHSKKLVSCDWSETNLIALVGEDRLLTINNENGDTLKACPFKGEGSSVRFVRSYSEEKTGSSEENCVAMVLNKKTLYIVNINDTDNPAVLNFPDWYEAIIDYF